MNTLIGKLLKKLDRKATQAEQKAWVAKQKLTPIPVPA